MFWDTLQEAGEILLHWRFWAVTFSYGALQLIPLLVIGVTAEKSTALGCITWVITGVAWPVFILTGTLLILAPLMIGHVDKIAWDFLGTFSIRQIAIIGGISFVATLIIALIPVLGHIQVYT